MNSVVLSGRVCTIPKIKLLQVADKPVSMCVFTIAVADGVFAADNQALLDESNIDYFECVSFGEAAIMINENFVKGSKIICRGRMKNHVFDDVNGTKHFTNVFLAEQAEFGDTNAAFEKGGGKKKSIELSVASDLKMIFDTYKKVCENGFLCIDEEDYYKIAMMCI